jgi:hypothetical protein
MSAIVETWEYRAEILRDGYFWVYESPKPARKETYLHIELNKRGVEGWEVISVRGGYMFNEGENHKGVLVTAKRRVGARYVGGKDANDKA